jgi:myomegalin
VAEIRALRGQLEQSIEVNNRLRLQLEQQMDRGAGKASLGPIAVGQSFPDKAEPANLHQGREEEESQSPLLWDVCGTGQSC